MEQTFPIYIKEYVTISCKYHIKHCDSCHSSLFTIFINNKVPSYIAINCYTCNRSIDSYEDDPWIARELIKVNNKYLTISLYI